MHPLCKSIIHLVIGADGLDIGSLLYNQVGHGLATGQIVNLIPRTVLESRNSFNEEYSAFEAKIQHRLFECTPLFTSLLFQHG